MSSTNTNSAQPATKAKPAAKAKPATKAKPASKLDALEKLLRRKNGASIEEMMQATGWQQHSVRGALAGAMKKRGHSIASEKVDGSRRYRIVEPAGE